MKRSLRRRRLPPRDSPFRLILDRSVPLDVKRRLSFGLAKIGHGYIRIPKDGDGVVVPILLGKVSHEPFERKLMGILRVTLQLRRHKLAISNHLEDCVASRHALVEVL